MRHATTLAAALCLLLGLGFTTLAAPGDMDRQIVLAPDGGEYQITCPTTFVVQHFQSSPGVWQVICVARHETPDDTVALRAWHRPGAHDGLNGHEHGDRPPSWVVAFSVLRFGHGIVYGGDEASSPTEDPKKHQAFKGYHFSRLSAGGTEVYFRYHAASNPMDRSAQFHSYEVYFKDSAGNVSFMQGVYDVGNPEPYPVGDRVPRARAEPSERPLMLVVDRASYDADIGCEQWYMHGVGEWAPEFALTICGTTYLYVAGENATAHDPTTWKRAPNQTLGLTRRAEVFWLPAYSPIRGWFCADKATGAVTSTGSKRCEDGSLPQYVAPTLDADARAEFERLRISVLDERAFPGIGVTAPN